MRCLVINLLRYHSHTIQSTHLKCIIQHLLVYFIELCNHYHTNFRAFLAFTPHPKKLCIFQQSSENHLVSIDFLLLDLLCVYITYIYKYIYNMWAFVTSFCTISYFNLSGINDLSWVGMAEMPIWFLGLRLRCTSRFFPSELKKKKKKISGNTAGCLPGLRGNDNSGGTAASRTTHLLLFSFRVVKTMFAKYETGTPGDGKYFSCFE